MKKWIWCAVVVFLLCINNPKLGKADSITLQQLIDEARPGAEIMLEAKQYTGPIRISKPIKITGQKGTIIQGDTEHAIIISDTSQVTLKDMILQTSGTAITINHTENVTLQNLIMKGVNAGIVLNHVQQFVCMANQIQGNANHYSAKGNGISVLNSENVMIEDNVIAHVQDGIYFEHAKDMDVKENVIVHSRYGTHFMNSEQGNVLNNQYSANMTGLMLMLTKNIVLNNNLIKLHTGYNATGVTLYSTTNLTIEQNKIEKNRVGISLQRSSNTQVKQNQLQSNQAAVESIASQKDSSVIDNLFVGNILNVRSDKFGIQLSQNYYDDYQGIDLNNDGFGDQHYVALQSFGQWMVRKPVYQYFLESPSVVLLNKIDEQTNIISNDLLVDSSPKDIKAYSSPMKWAFDGGQVVLGLLLVISCGMVYRRGVSL